MKKTLFLIVLFVSNVSFSLFADCLIHIEKQGDYFDCRSWVLKDLGDNKETMSVIKVTSLTKQQVESIYSLLADGSINNLDLIFNDGRFLSLRYENKKHSFVIQKREDLSAQELSGINNIKKYIEIALPEKN